MSAVSFTRGVLSFSAVQRCTFIEQGLKTYHASKKINVLPDPRSLPQPIQSDPRKISILSLAIIEGIRERVDKNKALELDIDNRILTEKFWQAQGK